MEEKLIPIRWHVDRTVEPPRYTMFSPDPDYPELIVGVSSAEKTERSAKADLMAEMYELAKQKGITARRLRFKVNGIPEEEESELYAAKLRKSLESGKGATG